MAGTEPDEAEDEAEVADTGTEYVTDGYLGVTPYGGYQGGEEFGHGGGYTDEGCTYHDGGDV